MTGDFDFDSHLFSIDYLASCATQTWEAAKAGDDESVSYSTQEEITLAIDLAQHEILALTENLRTRKNCYLGLSGIVFAYGSLFESLNGAPVVIYAKNEASLFIIVAALGTFLTGSDSLLSLPKRRRQRRGREILDDFDMTEPDSIVDSE